MFKFFPLSQAKLEGTLLPQLTTPQLQNLAGVNHELRQSCKKEFVRRQKIFNLVKTEIDAGDLSITQQKHLLVVNTIDEIARDVNKYIPNDTNEGIKIKIEQIVTRTAPEKLVELSLEEVRGIEAGLTREQVQTPNFCYTHVLFVQTYGKEFFARIAKLHSDEIIDVAEKLRREKQIQALNFRYKNTTLLKKTEIAALASIAPEVADEIIRETEIYEQKHSPCLIL